MNPHGPEFHDDDEVTVTPYSFGLMEGKKLMEEGINAEFLDSLTGNIIPDLDPEAQARIARARMVNSIIENVNENPNRRARAVRGFINREEERKLRRTVVAQVRRYHRYVDGQRFAEIEKRRIRKKRANAARRQHAVV